MISSYFHLNLLPWNGPQTNPKLLNVILFAFDTNNARFARHYEPIHANFFGDLYNRFPFLNAVYMMAVNEHSRKPNFAVIMGTSITC